MSEQHSLAERDTVVPSDALCSLRPELAGERGNIHAVEGDEVVVQWSSRPRLYRVPAKLLRTGT